MGKEEWNRMKERRRDRENLNNIYNFNDCFQTRSNNVSIRQTRESDNPEKEEKIFERDGNGFVAQTRFHFSLE